MCPNEWVAIKPLCDNWVGTLFLWLHAYYARLARERLEHSVSCESLLTTYIMLLASFFEQPSAHWCQQCVKIRHVFKCLSRNKYTVVITRRVHYFHSYMYIMPTLFLWDLSTLRVAIFYDRLYYAPCLVC